MSDLIDRQKVLNTLDNADKFLDEERTVEKYKELLTECIKVLPSAENKGDLISRQAVLETVDSRIEQIKKNADAINKSYSHLSFAEGVHDGYCRLKCDLRILPSVENKGEWMLLDECSNSGYYCSRCHKKVVKEGWSETVKKIKFCPNCGADMRGET
jgi:deoxyadenosine/deoxycytidine kinase